MVEPRASRSDVARLFGRAAFGATAADLDRWAGQPYVAVVDFLVNVPDPATRMPAADDARRILLETSGASLALNQGWWLERMRTTTYPLEERVTLFLHDHFATATTGSGLPDAGMLLRQNQTLRSRSLGNFRTLAGEITIDPAMLHWLSGVSNTRGRPNENYGRELLELFTLGTKPQVYTETDIREAARALTGWTYNAVTRQLAFNANLHDTGSKSVLGRTITNQGALEYLAVVNAALAQPIAARWLAYKLVLNFGYVPDTTDLLTAPDPLVAAVADALGPNWDLRNAVRTLLLADGFRFADAAAGRRSVRQPIETRRPCRQGPGLQCRQHPTVGPTGGHVPKALPTTEREWLARRQELAVAHHHDRPLRPRAHRLQPVGRRLGAGDPAACVRRSHWLDGAAGLGRALAGHRIRGEQLPDVSPRFRPRARAPDRGSRPSHVQPGLDGDVMTLTRRQFLAGSGALTGLTLLGPVVVRSGLGLAQAAVDPATAQRNRLVIIVQSGGNDGLNMVIPTADVAGAARYSVYRKVRPSIGYDPSVVLPLGRAGDADWSLGLNPKLTTLHDLYLQGRMAVVQGVDYPNHNYSHFASTDIWESGLPQLSNDSGWLGRHLDRMGIGDGELRGVGIGSELPLLLRGRSSQGVEIASLPLRFADGTDAVGDRRHAALKAFGQAVWTDPLRQYAADQAEVTVGTVETLEAAPARR